MASKSSVPRIAPYWKAAVAAVSAVGVGVAAIASDPAVTAVVPQSATQWVTVVVGGGIAGFLTWLKANQLKVDQIDKGIEELPLEDIEDLIRKYAPKVTGTEGTAL